MDEKYRRAVDAAAIFSETDLSGSITYVNDLFCQVSGYSREELLGANHRMLSSGLHPPEFFTELWQTITQGRVWKGEICNRAKDGSLYWVDSTMVPLVDQRSGRVMRYVSIRFDVSEKRQLLHSLQWRVGHDVLTGLPNRAFLSELLQQALDFSARRIFPWRCACSTWTVSRRSMTAMATRAAICCWWKWPRGCARSSAARMWWHAWPATSSC